MALVAIAALFATVLLGGTQGGAGAASSAAPAPVRGCAVDARGVPACGAYMGAAHGANDVPTTLEAAAGRPLGVRRTFYRADQVDSAVRTARADVRAGRLPWISFKLPTSWERMVAGDGDAWARDVARRLGSVGGPVWVAFHHEPEGDGDVQQWRRMQERLAPLVRGTAPSVGFTVILTGWNQLFGDPAYGLDRIWPRGVEVDVAGFDVYNEYGVVKNGRRIDTWPGLAKNYFRPLARWARANDVAWGLAETGLTDVAAQRIPDWIDRKYRQLVGHGGVAYAYFDTYLNAYGSWELSTPEKQRSFRAALRASPVLLP